jgi:hypothetical protein
MRRLARKLLARMRRSLGIEQIEGELTESRRMLDLLIQDRNPNGPQEVRRKLDQLIQGQAQAQAAHEFSVTQIQAFADRVIRAPEGTASKTSQLVLANQYRALARQGGPLPGLQDVEFRAFSQNGEDGLLLYVFSLIGMGDRRCVEVCAGDGIECNTANLIINHGWRGLLFDGNETLVERGRAAYAALGDTIYYPPRFVHGWISRDNINTLIRENGFEGDINLLSLDIDGIDYWLWEAIEVVRPRVVIAEVQCIWGADRAVTVPYAPDFRPRFIDGFGLYCGASLPAFVKLARRKGYRLVGVQRLGFNAVFVEDGVGEDLLPEVAISDCVNLPFVEQAQRNLLGKVKDLEWVEV